ncbi:tetratricopeptide repeat protein [Streptomyces sp. Isolate_219]|uniref:tetratricopeptide repeat protein n=1 Tax=Streptomyces sp. Isolate_219 TaxID=2950110 RepID=UPI0021C6419C|nr:tetratricopeptide repeat protein [Streptomyces sp. Isolate_219]MCR8576085.1 tetratricopeptide repeat protein [Streptomyces sp. Isolate_219]
MITSAHLFEESRVANIAVPGGLGVHECRIIWRRHDETCDAALLEASSDLIHGASDYSVEAIRWGKISGISALNGCEAIGYPQISLSEKGEPDTEQIVGTVKPGSSIFRGRYVLDNTHSVPAPRNAVQSPWQGMSGAALFFDEYLIGIISGDPTQWGNSRVEAIPVATLLDDADFCDAVQRSAGSRPRMLEVERQRSQSDDIADDSPLFPWQPVSETDPIAFGIHRVPSSPDFPDIVEYLPRSIDSHLDAILQSLEETGGMLLLTGDSASGKSRALYESMRRNLANWEVCNPDPDIDITNLPTSARRERKAVWLDDLHSYLHATGLTPALLDSLTNSNFIILATLRTEFYDHYAGEKGSLRDAGPRIPSSPGRVIRAAHHVALERIWDEHEREFAARSSDPRVSDALNSDRAYGLAEYLAAGPQVLRAWKSASRVNGNPRGAALVAAAVDLARTGVGTSIPSSSIERLHERYLANAGGPALRPEELDEAWQWAGEIILGVTSPLIPSTHGTWKPFDYLVSNSARESHPRDIPDEIWNEVLQIVDDSRRILVSNVAKFAGKLDTAKSALLPLAEADVLDGLVNLGAVLAFEKDYAGARNFFSRASTLGDTTATHNLGSLAYIQGDLEQARAWYTSAIENGEKQSIAALGLVHEKLGDQEGAIAIWRRGTEAGDPTSAFHYSEWLGSKWQSDEAKQALKVAADGDVPFAALSYAGLLLKKHDHVTANSYLTKAYETAQKQGYLGDTVGCLIAGVTAYAMGDMTAGREWWNVAEERGADIEWLVYEAEPLSPGLSHLAINRDIFERLGEEQVRLIMQLVWAGDCLDCGYPLRDGVPALYIDDNYNWGAAKLFHFGLCRFPRWNDSALQTFSKDVGISWKSLALGIPIEQELVPALLVNPSIEAAHLVLEDNAWFATSECGPRSASSKHLGLTPLWQGVPLEAPDNHVAAFVADGEIAVQALVNAWSAPADDRVVSLVRQYGGLLLITSSAFAPRGDPDEEEVQMVLQSWDTMARWVTLHPSAGT